MSQIFHKDFAEFSFLFYFTVLPGYCIPDFEVRRQRQSDCLTKVPQLVTCSMKGKVLPHFVDEEKPFPEYSGMHHCAWLKWLVLERADLVWRPSKFVVSSLLAGSWSLSTAAGLKTFSREPLGLTFLQTWSVSYKL